MKNETWKPVVGYEGLYEVSDLGRVRSLDRIAINARNQERTYKGKLLKPFIGLHNRVEYNLYKNTKSRSNLAHILVAEAFIGPRPEGYSVCHCDGNKENNKLSNLRYDTQSENSIDIYRYNHKKRAFHIEQVLEIRKLYATGNYSYKEIAEIYGVSKSSIASIIKRRSFQWLNDDGTIDESKTKVKHVG